MNDWEFIFPSTWQHMSTAMAVKTFHYFIYSTELINSWMSVVGAPTPTETQQKINIRAKNDLCFSVIQHACRLSVLIQRISPPCVFLCVPPWTLSYKFITQSDSAGEHCMRFICVETEINQRVISLRCADALYSCRVRLQIPRTSRAGGGSDLSIRKIMNRPHRTQISRWQ